MANSQLRPYPYDGSTDVNEFLESFARYAEFADWDDRKKASALKTMLKDNASRWLSRQNFHDAIAYDDLVQHIRQKYQLTQSQIFQLHSELASTKQQPQDTVDTYAERIEQLCNRLDIEDPAKTHHFVNGLKDIYKAHVLRTEPADFEDARTAARAEEGAQALTNKCTAGNKSDKIKAESDDEANNLVVKLGAALNAVTAGSEKKPQSVTCQSCNQLGHTAPSCPNPRYQNACQLCGSMYHLAPQCPSLVTHSKVISINSRDSPAVIADTNGATVVARLVISRIPARKFRNHSMCTGIQLQNAHHSEKVTTDHITRETRVARLR